jgi:hypothetical protein
MMSLVGKKWQIDYPIAELRLQNAEAPETTVDDKVGQFCPLKSASCNPIPSGGDPRKTFTFYGLGMAVNESCSYFGAFPLQYNGV